jgi:hypothetical protein
MKHRNLILSILFLSLGVFLTGCYTQFTVYHKWTPKNHYYQDQNQTEDTSYQSDDQAQSSDTNYYADDAEDSNGQVVNNYNYDFYPNHRYFWGYQPSFGFSMVYDPIWDDPWGYWYNPFYPAYCGIGYGYYYGGWGSPWYGGGYSPAWYGHNNQHGRPGDIGHIRNGLNTRGDLNGRSLTRLNGTTSRPASAISKSRDNNNMRSSRANETGIIRNDTRSSRSSDARVSSTPGSDRSNRASVKTDNRRNSSSRGTAVGSNNHRRSSAPNREARQSNSSRERRGPSQSGGGNAPSHQRVQSPSGGGSHGSSGGGRNNESSSHSRGR